MEAVKHVLRLLDGKPHAVRRSTGGWVAAETCQLVMADDGHERKTRIRVRFKDIAFGPNVEEPPVQCQSHVKLVSPEELRAPFSYDLYGPQQFMLDFGNGIVPVHVVHYQTDNNGQVQAYFADAFEVEQAANALLGTRISLQLYRVPRACLRYGDPGDMEAARMNASLQRSVGQVIPDSFRCGDAIEIAGGGSEEEIREQAQSSLIERSDFIEGVPVEISLDSEQGSNLFTLSRL